MRCSNHKRFVWQAALIFIVSLLWNNQVFALTFQLPTGRDSLVGEEFEILSRPGESLITIGRKYDIGLYELLEANPSLGKGILDTRSLVVIPSKFILPAAPRKGIIINLAEMRLYYYPDNAKVVITNPIGIGRVGWGTPLAKTRIIEKKVDPEWNVPDSVRAESELLGAPLPKVVPPGPENPLGRYAMRLGLSSYLIHSTNRPDGIGTRTTAGCIRMLPEDIEKLFKEIKIGTPVQIVNQPYKVGWHGNKLYLESHVPLNEDRMELGENFTPMVKLVLIATNGRAADIDWDEANTIAEDHIGIPYQIGLSYYKLSENEELENTPIKID